jgi:hypothetical protein
MLTEIPYVTGSGMSSFNKIDVYQFLQQHAFAKNYRFIKNEDKSFGAKFCKTIDKKKLKERCNDYLDATEHTVFVGDYYYYILSKET